MKKVRSDIKKKKVMSVSKVKVWHVSSVSRVFSDESNVSKVKVNVSYTHTHTHTYTHSERERERERERETSKSMLAERERERNTHELRERECV